MKLFKYFYLLILILNQGLWASDFSSLMSQLKSQDPAWGKSDFEVKNAEMTSYSKSLFWTPKLSLNISQRDSFSSFDDFSRSQEAGFMAQLNLWKNGADWNSWLASRSRLRAAQLKSQLLQRKLVSEYAQLLLKFEKLRQSRDIIGEQNKIQLKNLAVSRRRYESGLLSKTELEKIEVDTLLIEEQAFESEREWFDVQKNLELRLLDFKGTLNDWPWKSILKKFQKMNFKPILEISKHLEMLRDEKDAERAEVRSALAQLIGPSLDLDAAYGRSFENLKKLGSKNSWSLGLTLNWVLFDRVTDYAAYRKAYYSFQEKERDVEIAQRDNQESSERQWRKLTHSIEMAVKREGLQEKLKAMLLRSQNLFISGKLSENDLGIDRNRWLDSRLKLVEAWYQAHVSLIDICSTWTWEECPKDLNP